MKNMTKDAGALLDFVSGLSAVSPVEGKKFSDNLSPVAVPTKSKKDKNLKTIQAGKEEIEATPEKKEMMRTSIFIDKRLYRKFKAFSVEINHSITDLLSAAMADMIETGNLPKSLKK